MTHVAPPRTAATRGRLLPLGSGRLSTAAARRPLRLSSAVACVRHGWWPAVVPA